jgi:hypothetical protein
MEDPRPSEQIIALAHYSVQEYLVSDRIIQGSAKQYGMQEAKCHDAIARGSLKYPIQLQRPLSRETIEGRTLARYIAEFWSTHVFFSKHRRRDRRKSTGDKSDVN